jgi:hypothetical protein
MAARPDGRNGQHLRESIVPLASWLRYIDGGVRYRRLASIGAFDGHLMSWLRLTPAYPYRRAMTRGGTPTAYRAWQIKLRAERRR